MNLRPPQPTADYPESADDPGFICAIRAIRGRKSALPPTGSIRANRVKSCQIALKSNPGRLAEWTCRPATPDCAGSDGGGRGLPHAPVDGDMAGFTARRRFWLPVRDQGKSSYFKVSPTEDGLEVGSVGYGHLLATAKSRQIVPNRVRTTRRSADRAGWHGEVYRAAAGPGRFLRRGGFPALTGTLPGVA